MSRKIDLLKNQYSFSILSKIFIVILGFVYTVLQSRYLGASLKGDVAYISSITSITAIVLGCGIHQAYPYFKKKRQFDVAPLFTKLSLSILLLYFIISLIVVAVFDVNIKVGAIILLTPFLVYTKIVAYINMVENPNKKNMTEVICNLIEVLFIIFLFLFIAPSLEIGILALFVKDLLLTFIYTWRLRKSIMTPVHLSKKETIEIVKFGIFPMLALLMTTLNYKVDVIMLEHFVSSASVGVYSVGVMLAERVWLIPDAMKEVMISNLSKGKDVDEVCFVIRVCNVVCLFVVLGIVALGKPFINIFFGADFSGAYLITVVILIGVMFMVYYKMIGSYNIVFGKQKQNFIYLVISVMVNIVLNLFLIPRYGNIGAAIASIFSYGVAAGLFVWRFLKDNHLHIKELLIINKNDVSKVKKYLSKRKGVKND